MGFTLPAYQYILWQFNRPLFIISTIFLITRMPQNRCKQEPGGGYVIIILMSRLLQRCKVAIYERYFTASFTQRIKIDS